jgi:hypothetical protein
LRPAVKTTQPPSCVWGRGKAKIRVLDYAGYHGGCVEMNYTNRYDTLSDNTKV